MVPVPWIWYQYHLNGTGHRRYVSHSRNTVLNQTIPVPKVGPIECTGIIKVELLHWVRGHTKKIWITIASEVSYNGLIKLTIKCQMLFGWRKLLHLCKGTCPHNLYSKIIYVIGPVVPLSLTLLLLLLCYFHNILNISILEPFTTAFIKHSSWWPWFTKYFPQNKFYLKYFWIFTINKKHT